MKIFLFFMRSSIICFITIITFSSASCQNKISGSDLVGKWQCISQPELGEMNITRKEDKFLVTGPSWNEGGVILELNEKGTLTLSKDLIDESRKKGAQEWEIKIMTEFYIKYDKDKKQLEIKNGPSDDPGPNGEIPLTHWILIK